MERWKQEIEAFTAEIAGIQCGIPSVVSGNTLLSDREAQYLALYREALTLRRTTALGGLALEGPERMPAAVSDSLADTEYHTRVFEAVAAAFPILDSLHSGFGSMEAELAPLVATRQSANSQALALSHDIAQLQDELFGLRQATAQLDTEARSLMDRRPPSMPVKDPHAPLRRQLRIAEELAVTLIGGSGVDWAGDERLSHIILTTDLN